MTFISEGIKIDKIDVNEILVSKEEPYGTKYSFKCFIGYNHNDVIRPLCIKLPQIIDYGNTTMYYCIIYSKNLIVEQQCPLRLVTNNC